MTLAGHAPDCGCCLAEPAEKAVGRQFGHPLPARNALFQMLVDRLGERVVELAQAVRDERLISRMQRGLAFHNAAQLSHFERESGAPHYIRRGRQSRTCHEILQKPKRSLTSCRNDL